MPLHPTAYLFVPGNRPERFDKALASGADALVLDLEDAVTLEEKSAARQHIAEWLDQNPDARDNTVVRINDASSADYTKDCEWLLRSKPLWVMLSKAESAQQIDDVMAHLGRSGRVIALIETALGVRNVEEVARAAGVHRVAFGTLDYAVDMGIAGDHLGLQYAAAHIAHASRWARIVAPIAGVTPSLDNPAALEQDLAFASSLGFTAKLCIHPRQLAAVKKHFAPTHQEVQWARRVIEAAQQSQGAIQLDGRMVDRPVILKAQAVLDRVVPPAPILTPNHEILS